MITFREELQKKDEQLIAAGKGGGALGMERISQLETQLASASKACSQLHENISELEKQNASLQEESHRLSAMKYVWKFHVTNFGTFSCHYLEFNTPRPIGYVYLQRFLYLLGVR